MINYKHKCRVCGGPLVDFVNLGPQSIQGSFVYPNKPVPPSRKIEARVMRCDAQYGCGLVQNAVTISPNILYSNYGYLSSVSSTMKEHLQGIADSIKGFFSDRLPQLKVLDIGANDLFLLKQFPSKWKKVGVDPSDVITKVEPEGITIINQSFPCDCGDDYYDTFDAITSIACFYDIDDPIKFVKKIEYFLAKNGVWVLEFAYLPSVIKNLAYDGMVHEHLCLYSLSTFETLLELSGTDLRVFRASETETNGGSLMVWVCNKKNFQAYRSPDTDGEIIEIRNNEFNLALDKEQIYDDFQSKVAKHGKKLTKTLKDLKVQGEEIHAYGMSTKLNTILDFCNIGPELITSAADRSPNKWGAKTISGIPIISEEESHKTASCYLVGPYHFFSELLLREKETIEQGARFIFPLPEILIIDKENYGDYV